MSSDPAYVTQNQFVTIFGSTAAIAVSFLVAALSMYRSGIEDRLETYRVHVEAKISSLHTDIDIMQQVLMEGGMLKPIRGTEQCDIITAELHSHSWELVDLQQEQNCLVPMVD